MRDAPLALLCLAAAGGCSYDWTVAQAGPADGASDVATPVDGGRKDGATDAVADVPADALLADGADDATEAAPALPDCTPADEAPVQQALAAALSCNGTPGQCEVVVQNECDCPVVVAAQNQAKLDYVDAVAALLKTCVPGCPAGVGVCGTAPMKDLCIIADAGSSALACHQ